MAKENTSPESDPTPDDPNVDQPTGDGAAAEETIRIDNEDSAADVLEDKQSQEKQLETTVSGISEADANSGHSTIVPDPSATLIPADPSSDQATDVDATVILDTTVRVDPVQDASDDINATTDVDPGKKTVKASELDQTLQLDAPHVPTSGKGVRASGTVVYRGKRVSSKSDETSSSDSTIIEVDKEGHGKTVAVSGSILTSANIGETVNPRELSERDAKIWNSAVGNTSQDPSVLPPAIERTVSDEQFDRLRKCDVAPLKSDKEKASDYRLVRKLGQGGMGDVFVARQGSLDRLLALKLIRPLDGKKRAQLARTGRLETVEEERRLQFLSEAIVTGDLDHPNIVPIHDVALTSNNELFYAMKRVVGTPWSDVIKDTSRDENLEILLKAADAIGFAHTRGVVHRDIKPENIMLGDFGVVMVMDWGLALPTSNYEKQSSIFATSGLGGTPAFMAPEMATGPLAKIGPASDIYLLGATLYLIVTGYAPHQAKNVTECLTAVRNNEIREVPEEQQGELLDIALKAMESKPEDRFADVASFQKAIRDYRSHAESISLAARASEDLQQGKQNRSYSDFSRAAFRFEESIKSWEGNDKAHQGLAETMLVHADAAYQNGDFDLGLSLLDQQVPEHQPIIKKLLAGIQERESHAARLSLLRKVAVAMLAFIIVGGSVAMYVINTKRSEAEDARAEAEVARDDAEVARDDATKALAGEQQAKLAALAAAKSEAAAKDEALQAAEQEMEAKKTALDALAREETAKEKAIESATAEEQAKNDALAAAESEKRAKEEAERLKLAAENARDAAKIAQRQAESSTQRAEYEEYVSKIGLAKARLERNESDGAREILEELRDSPQSSDRVKGWEWRWLWRQANQSESSTKAESSITDLSMGPSGRQGVITLDNGKVDLFTISEDGQLTGRQSISDQRLGGLRATSVAITPSEHGIAVGTASGDILFLSPQARTLLQGHKQRVTDLQFTDDGLLVSGSSDRTVRVWDANSGEELTKNHACWHISPVRQVAIAGSASSMTLAVAMADDSTGQVAIWKLSRQGDGVTAKREGTFTDHRHPVSALAISPNGQLVASGDIAGNVLLFSPSNIPAIDYAQSIADALGKVQGKIPSTPRTGPTGPRIRFARLIDSTIASEQKLVSTATTRDQMAVAHDDVIKAIRFSKDGKALLTSSDDYTLKLWNISTRRLIKTLKGHGGWVVGAEFLRGESDVIVSASNDATLRSWRPQKYIGAFVVHNSDDAAEPPTRNTQAHADEIWSARFSPDQKRIVTASHDHTARVMEIDEDTLAFKQIARMEDEVLSEGTSFVAMSLQVDRPHRRLYIGSADAAIRIWDLELATEIGQASGTGLNSAFAVSSDGQIMLTGSSSPKVKSILWKLDPKGKSSPQIVHRLKGHDQSVTAFAISPDSKLLFTGDRDGYGILWDAETGERVGSPVEVVRGFRINAASFSVDGRELLLAADDEQLTRIDVRSRQRISRMNHDGFVTQVSLSPDGRRALTVSELSTETRFRSAATLWDIKSGQGQVLQQLNQRRDDKESTNRRVQRRITSAQFDAAGRVAVVGRAAEDDRPASVQVWNVDQLAGSQSHQVTGAAASVQPSTFTAPDHPQQTLQLPAILGTAEVVIPIDDRTMLTMNNNAAFKWDISTTELMKSYRASAALTEASFSFDGLFVATGSRSVKIWDANTGEALAKLESPHVGPVRSVQFAPKAVGPTKYLFATGGDDGIARLWQWDANTRKIASLRQRDFVDDGHPHRRVIRRVIFSPDSERLFAVGDDGLAQLWDRRRSITTQVAGTSDQNFVCGAFSQDGTCVAAGSTDRAVRVWVLPNAGGDPELPIVMRGHSDTVNDIALLGENKAELRLMTASSDGTARVWDPRLSDRDDRGQHPGAREILSLRRHTGNVNAIDATRDGRLLMTAGSDGQVMLWPAGAPPAKPKRKNLFDAI